MQQQQLGNTTAVTWLVNVTAATGQGNATV